MNEREILELCAKACGIEVIGPMGDDGLMLFNGKHWNPITSDGDCARMEAMLGIDLGWSGNRVYSFASSGQSGPVYFADHKNDKNAARRWASCAVAAEIGKAKESTK